MQAPACFNGFNSRPQPEMISVTESDPRIEFARLQLFKSDSLHRSRGAYGHEHRSLDHTATCCEHASTRLAFAGLNSEIDGLNRFSSNMPWYSRPTVVR